METTVLKKHNASKLDLAKYGPWALVTGAGRGLGAEFARQLAAQGFDLVLVDIDDDKLNNHANKLCQEFRINTKAICLDLARDDFMTDLTSQIEDLKIGLLVNNAGISKIPAIPVTIGRWPPGWGIPCGTSTGPSTPGWAS